MKIQALHERRSADLAVTPCHPRDAAIQTEVDRNPAANHGVRRQLKIHGRELPQHNTLTRKKNRRPVVEEVETGALPVPGKESLGLLNGRGDQIKAIFKDLTEREVARNVDVRHATPVLVQIRKGTDARALTALIQPIEHEELADVDSRCSIGPCVKIDRTRRAPLREVFPAERGVITPVHCPEVRPANAGSLYGGSGKARREKKPRGAIALIRMNSKFRKPQNRHVADAKG